ncbi:hypothetical protein BQ8420_22745 [Nocardiopsis sp. JB363]|nr:hypothetical protein BQ8420_22745 [Nocardiopsis sp. JB363]
MVMSVVATIVCPRGQEDVTVGGDPPYRSFGRPRAGEGRGAPAALGIDRSTRHRA